MRGLFGTALVVFWVILLALVGGRFIALLFDANADSELVERIYRHSDFWVKPFYNIFGLSNEAVAGGTFEPASLIAFAIYLVGGMVLGGAWHFGHLRRGHII